MHKLIVILIGLISFSAISQENTPEQLSLQEAIDFALKNNRNALLATKDVSAAKKAKMGNYSYWIATN